MVGWEINFTFGALYMLKRNYMKRFISKLTLCVFVAGVAQFSFAQEKPEKDVLNWYNGPNGMETEAAYKLVKKRETKTVVVAIIDSGIDIEHEDLKGKIWVNTDEIPGNGVDDDKNGYVDDVHGWNFLGNSNGKNAAAMQLERTRIYAQLRDRSDLNTEEQALFEQVSKELEEERADYEGYLAQMDMLTPMLAGIPAMLKEKFGTENVTEKMMAKYLKKHPEEAQSLGLAMAYVSGELTTEVIDEQRKMIQGMLDTHHNPDFDGRSIIGDNPDDFNDRKYGNSDVEGPDALHGTHVGGIVGAVRKNKLGGDGVANDVLLMSIRAVPDGDEYDKDIALAIRYAVDNGAQIINMSFGKKYSPHQKEVYEAFAYADSKGVLCIHAAGNDHKNIDVEDNFPTSVYDFQSKKLDHFLTIGSCTRKVDGELPSSFSNYGQKGVDVFAPGSEIYNSVPQSDYQVLQGTSMACPMVSGAAAMLKSYFPEMSMKQIAEVLLSTSKSYKGVQQKHPETKEMADFGTLSVTGGVINLKNAVAKCLEMEAAK